jgi:hypothetical protein
VNGREVVRKLSREKKSLGSASVAFTGAPEEGETCDDLLPSEANLANFRPPADGRPEDSI